MNRRWTQMNAEPQRGRRAQREEEVIISKNGSFSKVVGEDLHGW